MGHEPALTPPARDQDAPAAGGLGAQRPGAAEGRGMDELLRGVVADVGESLGFWSVDLWAFSDDADTLACRAYWCRDPVAAEAGERAEALPLFHREPAHGARLRETEDAEDLGAGQ